MSIIRKINNTSPKVGKDCFLSETSVIIGDVTIGDQCSIWYNTVLRGDVNRISVGNLVNIQDNATVHCTYKTHPTIIGDEVSIGHNAIVHGCTIREKVLVGMGAIIMDACVLDSYSIIAAGAVLKKGTKVKSFEVWAGIPAKKIGEVSPELKSGEIERIAKNYVLYSSWYK